MEAWTWIVIVAAAAVVLAVVALAVVRAVRRRRQRAHTIDLRERYGGEYDRAVRARGREEAEAELQRRVERLEQAGDHPLSAEESRQLDEEWLWVQTAFVDDPAASVARAHRLVIEVLERRGLPAERADDRAMAAALHDPELADRYRRALDVYLAMEAGRHDGRDHDSCRRAFLDYRAVFRSFAQPGARDQESLGVVS